MHTALPPISQSWPSEVFVGWGGEEGAGVAVGLGDYLDGTGSFRCFVARNIAPGLEELEEIVSSLAGSDIAVMVVTKNTFRSRRWRHELNFAYRRRIPILPYVAEKSPIPSLLDYMDLQRMKFDIDNPSATYPEVARFIPILVNARRRA